MYVLPPNIIYLFIFTYTCLLSVLTFRSILTFPWVELGGKVNITCAKTGYNASITFHTKPFYGGKLHRVTGEAKNTSTGRVICKVNGEWNGKIEISFTSHQDSPRLPPSIPCISGSRPFFLDFLPLANFSPASHTPPVPYSPGLSVPCSPLHDKCFHMIS